MYRRGIILSLLTLILIVLVSFVVMPTPGHAASSTPTPTATIPPELPLVLGKTVTGRASLTHSEVHCFDADPDKDYIVTVDSPRYLVVTISGTFVWVNKYGEQFEGGGGGGGGGGLPPDNPTSETLFRPGGRTVNWLPEGSIIMSYHHCIRILRYHEGGTTYRMKVIDVIPQALIVGQPVTTTTVNTTFAMTTPDDGLYLVQVTTKTGSSLTSIQAIGDDNPTFREIEPKLTVGPAKFNVIMKGSRLMVHGVPPYKVSVEKLMISEIGDRPASIRLTNDHPAAILRIKPSLAQQFQIEATVVSGKGALLDITYQPEANNNILKFRRVDLTVAATASETIPGGDAGPTYILAMLPNISKPDPSRSVTLTIATYPSQ